MPATPAAAGGPVALVWVAFKVGALSYGGGVVVVPLMRHGRAHLPLDDREAVPLGRGAGPADPRPVVLTVAVVGFAAQPPRPGFPVRCGAGGAGAIAGAALPLGLELSHLWQVGVLVLAAVGLPAGCRGRSGS